jgi:hypothetical protein
MKRGCNERIQLLLDWRRATEADWPPEHALADDVDWSRQMGVGFVAEAGDEKLFLFSRDWFGWPDPPEWGLASFNKVNGEWHLWGSFDVLPSTWKVPEVVHAEN